VLIQLSDLAHVNVASIESKKLCAWGTERSSRIATPHPSFKTPHSRCYTFLSSIHTSYSLYINFCGDNICWQQFDRHEHLKMFQWTEAQSFPGIQMIGLCSSGKLFGKGV